MSCVEHVYHLCSLCMPLPCTLLPPFLVVMCRVCVYGYMVHGPSMLMFMYSLCIWTILLSCRECVSFIHIESVCMRVHGPPLSTSDGHMHAVCVCMKSPICSLQTLLLQFRVWLACMSVCTEAVCTEVEEL